jgi:branched-chain amino acid transport system permease protein
MALADRVAVFDQGRLLAIGPAQQVMSDPEVVTAYLGTSALDIGAVPATQEAVHA